MHKVAATGPPTSGVTVAELKATIEPMKNKRRDISESISTLIGSILNVKE
jgi:hypothetical protein